MDNAVKAAITHARTARGAGDASNDWFSDVAGGDSFALGTRAHTQEVSADRGEYHHPLSVSHQDLAPSTTSPPQAPHAHVHEEPLCDECADIQLQPDTHLPGTSTVGDDEVTVMTVLISDPITTAVEKTLDSQGFPQMAMQLGTE